MDLAIEEKCKSGILYRNASEAFDKDECYLNYNRLFKLYVVSYYMLNISVEV